MVWHNTFPPQRKKKCQKGLLRTTVGVKGVKVLAVQTVWGCPSCRRMFLGLPHSTIILVHQYWWV
jgi:hypothetical protein